VGLGWVASALFAESTTNNNKTGKPTKRKKRKERKAVTSDDKNQNEDLNRIKYTQKKRGRVCGAVGCDAVW